MKKFFLTTLVLSACGHHRDVRPGADGIHKVTVYAPDEGVSARKALSQAQHFCKEQNKFAAIKSESTQYKGSMDENTRKTVKAASKAAQVVGFMGRNPHVRGTQPSDVIGGAGVVGGVITNEDDYQTNMSFVCQ